LYTLAQGQIRTVLSLANSVLHGRIKADATGLDPEAVDKSVLSNPKTVSKKS
jgi:hypothetical protein